MIPLLVIASLLLLVSGLVKVKAAARVEMGVPVLAAAELVAGVGIFSVVFIKEFTATQGLVIVVGSVVLIVVSSLQVGSEVRRRHRIRVASEGTRLANYVKYLSRLEPSGDVQAGRDADPRGEQR
jgi:hypothetical protein